MLRPIRTSGLLRAASIGRQRGASGGCAGAAILLALAVIIRARAGLAAGAGSGGEGGGRRPLDPELWVGKFSQCSYNAVGSVLTYYYGADGSSADRETFERAVFSDPLSSAGYGPYYGWGPWTGYMVESGKMVWNKQPVTALKAERFSLRTARLPSLSAHAFVVHYEPGERAALRGRLLGELARGPVVMWTCYAGAQERGVSQPWHHVSRVDDETDAAPFGPFTHSVTLFLLPRDPHVEGIRGDVDRIMVTDCSVMRGVFVTDPDTIVSTAAAMTGFVRLHRPGEKSLLERGLKGIEHDEYNVVFVPGPAAATAPAATQPAAAIRSRRVEGRQSNSANSGEARLPPLSPSS